MEEPIESLEIVKYRRELPDVMVLLNEVKDFEVNYSDCGNSTEPIGKMTVKRFLGRPYDDNDQLYVFHNTRQDELMFPIIKRLIPPPPTTRTMRISRLYMGHKGSGTHIHNHSVAVNYLIQGRKLWFTFPFTEHNSQMLDNILSKYGSILKTSVLDWLNMNYDYLSENMTNFQITTQEQGECMVVPADYYHGIVNLENVVGVTYSWY